MKEIAPELAVVALKIANVYLVGSKALWYLVDSGLAGEGNAIKKAVKARFGEGSKPAAIVLTHGHLDHSGSALVLADEWNVKVYAPSIEMPYLSGMASYPPADPTAPGFLSFISRFMPAGVINLGARLAAMNDAEPFPGLAGWRVLQTPGHSPGHVSFFRDSDGALLAGDAFTTINTESLAGILSKKQKVCRPPVPVTIDWQQAKASVQKLVLLKPKLLAPGHGKPMADKSGELQKLAATFEIPQKGRYVREAVQTSPLGVVTLPPAPDDFVPDVAKSVLVVGVALGIGAVYPAIRKRLRKKG